MSYDIEAFDKTNYSAGNSKWHTGGLKGVNHGDPHPLHTLDSPSPPKRPSCINYGCKKLAANQGSHWRFVCSRCHRASYMPNVSYAEGVTPFKKGMCSNNQADNRYTGELGFKCATMYSEATEYVKALTQLDHKDGNTLNGDRSNAQELCQGCHAYKGKLNGDFRRQGNKIVTPHYGSLGVDKGINAPRGDLTDLLTGGASTLREE